MTDHITAAEMESHLTRPGLWLTCMELPRALQEMAMLLPLHRRLSSLPKGDGRPVIVIPGFSADNRTTFILRHYLKQWGYAVEPWEMDQNLDPRAIDGFDDVLAFRENMKTKVGARIQTLHQETGKKVTLIGWSLGGIFSRVLASHNQSSVEHVITLGTPFGDPRTVPIYPIMEKMHHKPMLQRHFDEWLAMCNAPLGNVNLSILFSKSDGFVSRDIANNAEGFTQEAIHVCSSHAGFAVNPAVLYLVALRLRHPEGQWERFSGSSKLTNWLFKAH